MRRWLVRSLQVLILLGVLFAVNRYVYREQIREAARQRYVAELQRIVIPNMELQDTPFEAALAYLVNEGRKGGMQPELRFDVLGEAEAKKRFHRKIAIPPVDSPQQASAPEPYDPLSREKITVSLTNIPLVEACKYVVGLSRYEMIVQERAVLLIPELPQLGPGTYLPYETRTLARLFSDVPEMPKLANGHYDARPYLRAIGMAFYEGTSAEYDAQTQKLVMVNTSDQLDLFESAVTLCYLDDPHPKWWSRLCSLFHPASPIPTPIPPSNSPPSPPSASARFRVIPGQEPLPGEDAKPTEETPPSPPAAPF